VNPEDKAVGKIIAALSDRQVHPRLVGITLSHMRYYTDSAATKEILDELISGIQSGP
jgi:hypothetical protein